MVRDNDKFILQDKFSRLAKLSESLKAEANWFRSACPGACKNIFVMGIDKSDAVN